MNAKRLTLLVVLLLSALLFSGCVLFHHGPRHCNSPCEMSEGKKPCPQAKNCEKKMGNKPCCAKMPAAETPAQ